MTVATTHSPNDGVELVTFAFVARRPRFGAVLGVLAFAAALVAGVAALGRPRVRIGLPMRLRTRSVASSSVD